jgi:hypothetical protein
MQKVYYLLMMSLALLTTRVYGQTNRAVSVLLHETFENNSTTISSWTKTPSSGCSAYNWTTQNSSGKGALGSAGYWLYPSSAATAGCYATAATPTFTAFTAVDKNDSIAVDLYIYRVATTSGDYISVVILDENNNPIFGPYAAFANDAKSPASGVGWCHLTWNIGYYNSIYTNLTTNGFKVGFTGISEHGVDLQMDEVSVSHSFTHNSGISPFNKDDNYFSCYPNPAHSSLNLQFSGTLTENTTLNLYNVSGKQIITKSIPAGSSESSIDTRDMLNGLYILEVRNNEFVSRKEVMIN